ncbi:hypothetical protein GWO43_16070 [candidate division KSB1 bacterium]|nr:hypothetical protein [candidate division KSB1 bacterium]NIV68750.1 hypothetical protein [Phycisphaerae bacterium]NIS25467.1 hypothetical protein [candidate division KSB1 bacterium]NIT72360.1 hypothetical protein [candidate division KSB1 bacterium]NIU26144.1 hypothetical protein [candidate division KSB1 bacterium]
MKTAHKITGISLAGILGLGTAVFAFWEQADKYVVTETDLVFAMQSHQQEMEPWTQQTEANTLDRLLRKFEYLEKKKCHGGGLTVKDEIEFQNILKQLDYRWEGCHE